MGKNAPGSVHVCVIGDVMLDIYHFGDVNRISPEAPVPVVHVTRTAHSLGGAANVARNIRGLAACATLIGAVGNDANADVVAELAQKEGMTAHLFRTDMPTITKCRIIGVAQQMLRFDFERRLEADDDQREMYIDAVDRQIEQADVVILSDYGKGYCSDYLCTHTIAVARNRGVPVIVDPKSKDWTKYAGASFITPNFKEFCEAAGESVPNEDSSIEKYSPELLKKYRFESLVVTRSHKGMSCISPEKAVHIHSEARDVYDVSGAGDTVVATLAVGLGLGLQRERAVRLANSAAGVVVGKIGTTPIAWEEIRQFIQSDSIEK
jgi:D-beta-D-heptose 7-phosphate kinase/D-beta-D-heptose 1-phosphate adenosyltransferase